MGMYTEIFVNCSLKEDTPEHVVHDLRLLFDPDYDPEEPADDGTRFHDPIFTQGRMVCIGHTSSFYFQPRPTSAMWFNDIAEQWFICSRSDLKNYDGEIEKFFAWLQPHVDEYPGTFIGYHRYEEDDLPTLVVKEPADD